MRKILVVRSDYLLVAGVESILAKEMDLLVIGIAPQNHAELQNEIERFQPEVVIFDQSVRLSTLSTMICSIDGSPGYRIIVMNLDDNQVEIYEKHQKKVSSSQDLLSAIRWN